MSTVAATTLDEPDHGVFSAIRWAVVHDLRVALRSRAELARRFAELRSSGAKE